jgi:hypothetical protein
MPSRCASRSNCGALQVLKSAPASGIATRLGSRRWGLGLRCVRQGVQRRAASCRGMDRMPPPPPSCSAVGQGVPLTGGPCCLWLSEMAWGTWYTAVLEPCPPPQPSHPHLTTTSAHTWALPVLCPDVRLPCTICRGPTQQPKIRSRTPWLQAAGRPRSMRVAAQLRRLQVVTLCRRLLMETSQSTSAVTAWCMWVAVLGVPGRATGRKRVVCGGVGKEGPHGARQLTI